MESASERVGTRISPSAQPSPRKASAPAAKVGPSLVVSCSHTWKSANVGSRAVPLGPSRCEKRGQQQCPRHTIKPYGPGLSLVCRENCSATNTSKEVGVVFRAERG